MLRGGRGEGAHHLERIDHVRAFRKPQAGDFVGTRRAPRRVEQVGGSGRSGDFELLHGARLRGARAGARRD